MRETNREEFHYIVPDFHLNKKFEQLNKMNSKQKAKSRNSCAMNAVGLVVKIEELVMKQSARKIWEKIAKIMSVQHRAQEKAIFSPKQWRTLGLLV